MRMVNIKRWSRPFLYLLLIMVWLLVMTFPFLAAVLAVQGQIEVGGNGRRHVRIFLIQQAETEGVSVAFSRPLRDRPQCHRTSLIYLMWRGEGENASFCQCVTPEGDTIFPETCP